MEKLRKILTSLPVRITVAVILPLLLVFGVWLLANGYVRVPCLFYTFTGIYCPGCGAGRAAKALLRFDFLAAIGHNVLFCFFAPFIGYYLLKLYIAYVFQKDVLPFFRIGAKTAITILIVIIAFFILRNIPIFPFNVLAP